MGSDCDDVADDIVGKLKEELEFSRGNLRTGESSKSYMNGE
jgi:hypothetical protein